MSDFPLVPATPERAVGRWQLSSAARDRLLTPGERWGWQCADLSRAMLPFPQPPPQFVPVLAPDWESLNRAVGQQAERKRETVRKVLWLGVLPFTIAASSVLLFIVYDVLSLPVSTQYVVGDTLLIGFGVGWVVYWWRRRASLTNGGFVRERVAAEMTRYEASVAAERARYGQEFESWQARKSEFDQMQAPQLERLPLWGAATLLSRPSRVEIFGDTAGWSALLVNLGTSLLAAGEEVLVLDLSDQAAYRDLSAVVNTTTRIRSKTVDLPTDVQSFPLLDGMTAVDVRDVVIEATHSDLDGATREQRALADRVLTEITEQLQPNLTMARIWRGLRTVTGQEPLPAAGSDLTVAEWDALSMTFGEDYRVRVGEHLMGIENQLYALRNAGRRPEPVDPTADLTSIVVGGGATTVTTDLLVSLVLARCIRRLRARSAQARPITVVVIGADAVPETMLQRLFASAENGRARLVTMYRNFEERHLERAASGGAVGFFRLANEAQASRAADVIGREHRFVLSQLTTARGTTSGWSATTGSSDSSTASWSNMDGSAQVGFTPAQGGDNLSIGQSTSQSWSTSGGVNMQTSSGTQRVEEHVVNPTALRGLADGALLLVEFSTSVGRRIVAVDVDPRIAGLARVSTSALPENIVPGRNWH